MIQMKIMLDVQRWEEVGLRRWVSGDPGGILGSPGYGDWATQWLQGGMGLLRLEAARPAMPVEDAGSRTSYNLRRSGRLEQQASSRAGSRGWTRTTAMSALDAVLVETVVIRLGGQRKSRRTCARQPAFRRRPSTFTTKSGHVSA